MAAMISEAKARCLQEKVKFGGQANMGARGASYCATRHAASHGWRPLH
jgi:hypothetical protein